MDEQALRQRSVEILADLKEWRKANPRATYVQIEEEVHRRLMHLEARLIENAVEQSPSQEWGKGKPQEAALCPKCATPLQARGQQKRTFQGNGGEDVTLKWSGRVKRIGAAARDRLIPERDESWRIVVAEWADSEHASACPGSRGR